MEPCKLIIGNRGSGKSWGLFLDLLRLAVSGLVAVLYFDPKGNDVERMIGYLVKKGLESRIVFEQAAPKDGKFLSWPFIEQIKNDDPIERQIEQELEDEAFKVALYSQKEMKSGRTAPYTRTYLDAGTCVFRSQPALPPIGDIRKLFIPWSPEQNRMLDEAEGEDGQDAAGVFRRLLERSALPMNRKQWEIEAGSAGRMLDVFKSPAVYLHHGNSFDWTEAIRQRKQIYFDLSGVPNEIKRAIAIFAYTRAIACVRRSFNETKKPLPLVVVLEEAGALDLVTPTIMTAMQELRAAGISVYVVSQTIYDFDS